MESFMERNLEKSELSEEAEKELRARLDGKTKETLVTGIVKQAAVIQHGEVTTAGRLVGGNLLGVSLGELVNLGFRLWGKSEIPLATTIAKAYPYLRVVPHAVLGVVAVVLGRKLMTKTQVLAWAAGQGLMGQAISRGIDKFEYEGDLSQAEEVQLRQRVQALEAQLVAAQRGQPQP